MNEESQASTEEAKKKSYVDTERLMQDLAALIPIKALPPAYFQRIASTAEYQDLKAGDHIFRVGDRDNAAIYLLEGSVEISHDDDNQPVEHLDGDTFPARYALAPSYPRQSDVRALTDCRVVRVNRSLLDIFLTWCQSAPEGTAQLDTARDNDWIMRMLQLTLFEKLPPENLQAVIVRMEPVPVEQGQVIIEQGTPGDYYYVIRRGRAAVTRKIKDQPRPVKLAELAEGDSFGEEALVSGTKRNANVIMLSAGVLMRLAKEDFLDLIKQPLDNEVDYFTAESRVSDRGVWLDVRLPDEYKNGHFIGSLNLPLPSLRLNAHKLDRQKIYVLYCDTGRRSAAAAFLLQQLGYESYVLGGGLMNLPKGVFLESGSRKSGRSSPKKFLRSDQAVRDAGKYDDTERFITGAPDAAAKSERRKIETEARKILAVARDEAAAIRKQAQHEAAMVVENAKAAVTEAGTNRDDKLIDHLTEQLHLATEQLNWVRKENKKLRERYAANREVAANKTAEAHHTIAQRVDEASQNPWVKRAATAAAIVVVAGLAYYLGSTLREPETPTTPTTPTEQTDPRKSAG
jgi:CRP-like cAMP-binding protein/rhodanese-related sulfurtransferase